MVVAQQATDVFALDDVAGSGTVLAGLAAQAQVDPLAELIKTLRVWERSPPAGMSESLQDHLQPLIALTMSLERLPSVADLVRGLALTGAAAGRLHAELVDLLRHVLRR